MTWQCKKHKMKGNNGCNGCWLAALLEMDNYKEMPFELVEWVD